MFCVETRISIEELLEENEGEFCQFKEWKNKGDYDKTVQICSAIANRGGGKLVLGVTDKRPRKVVGTKAFPQPERTRLNLMDKLGINIDFFIHQHENGRVLVFDVATRPVGLPIQADGIAWWYRGDSLIPLPEDIRRTIYAEIGHDFSADICHGITIHDLDKDAIAIFREKWAKKSRNARISHLSDEQLLIDCEAISDKGITYAALILFGTRVAIRNHLPQFEIIFEYRSSDASGPAQQREEFQVGFFSCFDKIWELINRRNDLQHYRDGLFVFDIPTFNENVIRESLLNSVSHRNHQMSGSVFVRQYKDRLVVESPGGLPTGLSLDNILSKQVPRNRRIAEIFALCGLVERAGQGMNLIYELSIREAKSLPTFNGTDSNFVTLTLNGVVLDVQMLLLMDKIGMKQLEVLSTDEFLVIDALFFKRKLPRYLQSHTARLVEMEIIERTGKNKYAIARRLFSATDKSGTNTHQIGFDHEASKELILTFIRENGDNGAPLRSLTKILPSYSERQIQGLLGKLRESGSVVLKGKTTAARWYISDND